MPNHFCFNYNEKDIQDKIVFPEGFSKGKLILAKGNFPMLMIKDGKTYRYYILRYCLESDSITCMETMSRSTIIQLDRTVNITKD